MSFESELEQLRKDYVPELTKINDWRSAHVLVTPNDPYVQLISNHFNWRISGDNIDFLVDQKPWSIDYERDIEQFGVRDKFVQPSYFIHSGMKGDCEDSLFTFVSVLKSKGIPYKMINGWIHMNGFRGYHAWCECKINNVNYAVTFGKGEKSSLFYKKGNSDKMWLEPTSIIVKYIGRFPYLLRILV